MLTFDSPAICSGLAGVLLFSTVACAAQPAFVPMDPHRPIQRDDGYRQDGKPLDPEQMTDELSKEPASSSHVSRAKTLSFIAMVLGTAGGALVGWPLGAKIGGNDNPPWGLAYAGAGAIVVSVPLTIWATSSLDDAVDAHNEALSTPATASP